MDGELLRKVHIEGEVEHLPSLVAEVALPLPACPSGHTQSPRPTQAGKGDYLYATSGDEVLHSGLGMGSQTVTLQKGMRVTTPTHPLLPSFMGGPGTLTAVFPPGPGHVPSTLHMRATTTEPQAAWGEAAPQPSCTLNYLQ